MKKILAVISFILFFVLPRTSHAALTLSTDFNTGPLNQNVFMTTCVTSQDPNDPTNNVGYLTNEYSQDGGMSFKAQVRKADPICGYSHRAEMHLASRVAIMQNATWVAWDTLQPATQPDDPVPFSSGQMHGLNGVPFSVQFYNSNARFVIQNSATGSMSALTTNKTYDFGYLQKGKWHKWIVHYKKSTGADGFFQVWLDGVQRVNYTGPTMDGGETGWYFKFGIYKWNILTSLFDTTVSYTDNVRMGDETATLSDFITPSDTTIPTGTLTTPTTGSTVSGTVILAATASDNVGVRAVNFFQGSTLIASDTTAPYAVSWDTTTVPNGTYQVKGIIIDTSNNTNTTNIATITVANGDSVAPVVSLSSPVLGSVLSGTTALSATASDNVGVAKVDFYQGSTLIASDTTAPYAVSWDTTTVPSGAYTLTAVARDAAGNSTTSLPVVVLVSNVTASGLISLVSPLHGSTVSGTISVTASVLGSGVTRVDFFKDADTSAFASTASLYTTFFDTTTLTNGVHTFRAVQYNGTSVVGTSAPVVVTVYNGSGGITTTSSATPSAPTAPRAQTGNTRAYISWGSPLSNGGSPITSYTVTAMPGALSVTTTTLNATLTGLTNGTNYTFTIRANNASGTGAGAVTGSVVPSSVYPVNGQVMVVATSLNVRKTAGGVIAGSVTKGTIGTVLQNSGSWTLVQFPAVTGWVSNAYIFVK